ncbi:Hypothetical predicted protein [Xyrichtys novacula]|uniref:Uncharacterized protein n=1 Tax=Xyrichtys novacula TaxID=13765 RepID=A0AAV1GD95_XYRNO|nr:Hypothetical predicted protein [Xyrichtys novacula]
MGAEQPDAPLPGLQISSVSASETAAASPAGGHLQRAAEQLDASLPGLQIGGISAAMIITVAETEITTATASAVGGRPQPNAEQLDAPIQQLVPSNSKLPSRTSNDTIKAVVGELKTAVHPKNPVF